LHEIDGKTAPRRVPGTGAPAAASSREVPMIVSEIMTTDVATCTPQSDLGHAIYVMLERDCGFVPIVNERGTLVGVVTDRDICIAMAAHRRTPVHIRIEEVMTHPVFSCAPGDSIITALGVMSQHHVRRLPVIDREGLVHGVLAINDILLAPSRPGAPTREDIVETMRAICRHRSMDPTPA
jgi:CBS domain-containing protein